MIDITETGSNQQMSNISKSYITYEAMESSDPLISKGDAENARKIL